VIAREVIQIYETHNFGGVRRDGMTIMNGESERMEEEGVTGKPRESSVTVVRYPLIFEEYPFTTLRHVTALLTCSTVTFKAAFSYDLKQTVEHKVPK
jgi:hypothetical protein